MARGDQRRFGASDGRIRAGALAAGPADWSCGWPLGERGRGEAAGGVVGAREAEELRSLGIDPTFGIALNLVYSLVAFSLFVWALGRARRRAPSTAPPDSRAAVPCRRSEQSGTSNGSKLGSSDLREAQSDGSSIGLC